MTLYRCSECGHVESHELTTHIMRSHRPGGPFRPMDNGDEATVRELQQRIEIPVDELCEHIVEVDQVQDD